MKKVNDENYMNKGEDDNNIVDIKESKFYSNTVSITDNEVYNSKNCLNEKKIIIYLITIALLLSYYSLFFINNINFRGVIKSTQSIEVEYPQNKHGDNNIDINNTQANNIANNTTNNNTTNEIVNSNMNNNVTNNSTGGNIVNNKDRFKIMQGKEDWKDLKSLDIFNNYYFNDNSIIAPGVHGEYSFTVENYKETKVQYNLGFIEQNIYNINMVYKLKLNGLYIAGDEQRFVKCNELNKENLVLNSNTNDVFTIEWKWQDNNNDTQIGKTEGATYRMHIEVNASELQD